MKGQGLPMQTIIIIVLTLFVLAGVGIFFFGQFGEGTSSTNEAQCIQLCESAKAKHAQATASGSGICADDSAPINYCNSCDSDCRLDLRTTLSCTGIVPSVRPLKDYCFSEE